MDWAVAGQLLYYNRSAEKNSGYCSGRSSGSADLHDDDERRHLVIRKTPRACRGLVGSMMGRVSLAALNRPASTLTLPADNLGSMSSIVGRNYTSCSDNITIITTSGETSSSAGGMLSATFQPLYPGGLVDITPSSYCTFRVTMTPSLLVKSRVALPTANVADATAEIARVGVNVGQGWRGANNADLRASEPRAEAPSAVETEDASASEKKSVDSEPTSPAAVKNVSDWEVLRPRHQTPVAPRHTPWWLWLLRRRPGKRRRWRRCGGTDDDDDKTVSCHRDKLARNRRPGVTSEEPEVRSRGPVIATDRRRPRHLSPTEVRRRARPGASTATSVSFLAGTAAALLLTATVGVVGVNPASTPGANTALRMERGHQQRQQEQHPEQQEWLESGLKQPLEGREAGGFGQSEKIRTGDDGGEVGGFFRPRLWRRSLKKQVDQDDHARDTDLEGFYVHGDEGNGGGSGGGGSGSNSKGTANQGQGHHTAAAVSALVIGGNFTLNGKTTNVAQYDPVR